MEQGVILKRCNYQGDPAWKWLAPNGRTFYFYRTSPHTWRFIRDDHFVSSVAYETLEAARSDLERLYFAVEVKV